MSRRQHNHKHTQKKLISPYDREFTQLNQNMFVDYGVGMDGVGHDEFHEKFKTMDVRRHPETRDLKTTALAKDGTLKERTAESLRLLEQGGLEGVDWAAWKRLMPMDAAKKLDEPQTGKRYVDGTDTIHQFVMTDSDPRYNASLDARYGERFDNHEVLIPPPKKTLKKPQPVSWSGFGEQLFELSPIHFIESGEWPHELELMLAPLLRRSWISEEARKRACRAAALDEWMEVPYKDQHILSYWHSRVDAELFVVFLVKVQDNQVLNYFYIPGVNE